MRKEFDRDEFKVILAYIAVCIIWGSTYLAIRIGVSELPPELFMGIRFTIAGLIMLAFAKAKKMEYPTLLDIGKEAVVGLFLILGANGIVVYAEQWVHSGITALILAITPLFMAIIELFLPGQNRLKLLGWGGLVVGFGGVVLLVMSGAQSGIIDGKGGIMLLVAAVLWSVGSVYSKSFTPSGSIVTHVGFQMLSGGLGQCLVGLLLGEASRFHYQAAGLGATVYLIFVGSIIGYGSYVYMLSKWPAAKAGTYAYVNPVVAVILGALILGEPVGINMVISIVIILGGVLMVQLSRTAKRADEIEAKLEPVLKQASDEKFES